MPIKTLQNEDGFALITSILFLSILTIIGTAAINTTTLEFHIAGNENTYRNMFYLAEGAAKEAATQNLGADWVFEPNKSDNIPTIGDSNLTDFSALCTQVSDLGTNTSYGVIDNDIPQGVLGSGHSLKVEGTGSGGRINFFEIYGRSAGNSGMVNIEMGYIKRL